MVWPTLGSRKAKEQNISFSSWPTLVAPAYPLELDAIQWKESEVVHCHGLHRPNASSYPKYLDVNQTAEFWFL